MMRHSRRMPSSRPAGADEFIRLCRDELQLPVVGLMCVPPADVEAAPYFALLAKLARDNGVAQLSMGMSQDYETAVMLGATHVRVGTALFGKRSKLPGAGEIQIKWRQD